MRFPEFNDEWQQTTLGVALLFETGYPFSSDRFNEEGDGIRLIKNRDLKADDRCIFYSGDYDERYIVQDGDVLIGMDGDFSPCLWKKGIALLNQRVGRIKVKGEVSSNFMYHLLGGYLKDIELKTASTTVKHLSHKDVENIKAILPGSTEQEKIATFLSLLDERIEAQRQTIKERKNQKKALLSQIFSQALRFPEFNDEWLRTTLGEVAEIRGRIGYRGYTTEDLVSEGCGALTIGGKHISQNRLDLSNPDYLSWDKFFESPEIMIEQGDIIIAQRGTLGRSALVKYDIGEATINPSVLILRHKFINASFLHYTLLRDDSVSYVMRCASKTSIPMISQKQLGDLPICQTSSAEQERIASFLSLIDERIEVEEQLLRRYEEQKRYLLRKMFV